MDRGHAPVILNKKMKRCFGWARMDGWPLLRDGLRFAYSLTTLVSVWRGFDKVNKKKTYKTNRLAQGCDHWAIRNALKFGVYAEGVNYPGPHSHDGGLKGHFAFFC